MRNQSRIDLQKREIKSLLRDIRISELQEKQGKVLRHTDLKKRSKEWLK